MQLAKCSPDLIAPVSCTTILFFFAFRPLSRPVFRAERAAGKFLRGLDFCDGSHRRNCDEIDDEKEEEVGLVQEKAGNPHTV